MGSTTCSKINCPLIPGDPAPPTIQKEASTELSHEGLLTSPWSVDGAPPQVENEMKRELKYYFMNPYEKYKARGRKPWKLAIQIIKIVLVTAQVRLIMTI